MSVTEPRPRGGLERDVLACLGAETDPMTPAEVLAALGGGMAYTTVMTTLSRLADKGALTRDSTGRSYVYRLAGDRDTVAAAMTARRMRRALDSGPDRAGVLARFVAELSQDEERVLADLLASGSLDQLDH